MPDLQALDPKADAVGIIALVAKERYQDAAELAWPHYDHVYKVGALIGAMAGYTNRLIAEIADLYEISHEEALEKFILNAALENSAPS